MANSENDKNRGQGPNRNGNAQQPFGNPDEQRPGQPSRQQTNGDQIERGQAETNQAPGTRAYSGQPPEPKEPLGPLGQTNAGDEANSTHYPGDQQRYSAPIEQSSETAGSSWLNEPQSTPIEQTSAASDEPRPGEPLYTAGTTQPVSYQAYQSDERVQPVAPASRSGRTNILAGALTGALLCLLLGGLVGWQIGKHNAPLSQNNGATGYKSGGMTPEQVIAQDRQAVVQINVKTAQGGGVGSGVIIDSQGNIITNDHVVSGGQTYNVVLFDGTSLPAKLVGVDTADDLAVVKIRPPAKMFVMPVGDSSKLEVGNSVLAIGNPLGITQTVTQGIVSALGRTVSEGHGGGTIVNAVQTDAPINPGNSGGALVSLNGNLVGIPTLVAIDPEFKTPANGVGFAVPSNRVRFIAPQLIRYGKVIHSGRAALQASVTTVDPLVAAQAGLSVDHGVLIVATTPKGAAANAGLRAGDVIVQINNQTINNVSDLGDALLSYDPGATVTVNIVRGTQQQQVKVKLSELTV
jgi:S1-C subfamily serine protease